MMDGQGTLATFGVNPHVLFFGHFVMAPIICHALDNITDPTPLQLRDPTFLYERMIEIQRLVSKSDCDDWIGAYISLNIIMVPIAVFWFMYIAAIIFIMYVACIVSIFQIPDLSLGAALRGSHSPTI